MLARELADVFARERATALVLDLTAPAVLVENLILVHHIIRASEDLLIAASGAILRGNGSPFDERLRSYYIKHFSEELDHAKWLTADLASVGVDPLDVMPRQCIIDLVGGQYYLVKHVHPVALLSYMAFLEWGAMPMSMVEELESIHGTQLLRTIRHHSKHDIAHGNDLAEMLDAAPPQHHALLIANGAHTPAAFYEAARDVAVSAIEREFKIGE